MFYLLLYIIQNRSLFENRNFRIKSKLYLNGNANKPYLTASLTCWQKGTVSFAPHVLYTYSFINAGFLHTFCCINYNHKNSMESWRKKMNRLILYLLEHFWKLYCTVILPPFQRHIALNIGLTYKAYCLYAKQNNRVS